MSGLFKWASLHPFLFAGGRRQGLSFGDSTAPSTPQTQSRAGGHDLWIVCSFWALNLSQHREGLQNTFTTGLIHSPGTQGAFSVSKTAVHPTHRGRPHDSTFLLFSESLSYLSSSPFPLKIVGVRLSVPSHMISSDKDKNFKSQEGIRKQGERDMFSCLWGWASKTPVS